MRSLTIIIKKRFTAAAAAVTAFQIRVLMMLLRVPLIMVATSRSALEPVRPGGGW